MQGPTVAIVVRDPDLRLEVAKAFDHAPKAWTVRFSDEVPAEADVVVFDDRQGRDGVSFDLNRPEAVLAEVQARLERPVGSTSCRLVVVTGVRGSGVTSVAIHLAAAASRRSETCFVDLDRTWSCAPRLGFGRDVITWGSAEPSSQEVALSSVPVAPGLRAFVAPASDTQVRPAGLLEGVRSRFESVVVDVPHERLEPEVAATADSIIVVLSPCLPHAHRGARILQEVAPGRVAVIANRLGPGGETTRTQIESILGRKVALELPTCPGLRDAEGRASLVSLSWTRWGRALVRLSRALERT